MDWIRRNPKAASGLGALAVLLVIVIVWGASGGSGSPEAQPTLGPPTVSDLPSASNPLTALPLPKNAPSGSAFSAAHLPPQVAALVGGLVGAGGAMNAVPHRVVFKVESDGPINGVGWWIPTAHLVHEGSDVSHHLTFTYAANAYGKPKYSVVFAQGGADSTGIRCTITVDGKVADHREAQGPWGQVACAG